jgi:hypothetical protein
MKNFKDFKIVQKMSFDQVDFVFDALTNAFYPNGFDEDIFDDSHKALWVLFLNSAGWNEEEYWDEVKEHHTCTCCKEESEKQSEDDKKSN